MKPIIYFDDLSEITDFIDQEKIQHPMVAVVDFSKMDQNIDEGTRFSCAFYCVMFKNYCTNSVKYGRQSYDFQDGSVLCIAPKQVISVDTQVEGKENMMGWGLFFHPDFIRNTSLARKINTYSFFSYEASEALHLSEKEKQILYDCVLKIETELKENIDSYSQILIASNIELLLNYCTRYYGRQFITRKNVNRDIISTTERLIKDYFNSISLKQSGLLTVKYLANQIHLSPSYLSDLLKKETGMSAQDHIHFYLIEEAKNALKNSDYTINEIAYSLGFDYPQYFNKLFKNKTNQTPLEYRNSFN